MASRTRTYLTNTFWSLAYQLVVIASGLIVPIVIIGTFGSAVNGLVSSLGQLVSYVSLVEAGISAAAVYALYDPLARGDLADIGRIVTSAKRFYYRAGCLFVALVAGLAVAYPLLVDCGGLTRLQVSVIVFFLGAPGFLDFFTLAKYRVLLMATQRNWVIQIASCVYRCLYIVVVLVSCKLGTSLEAMYAAAVTPILVRTAILVVYTRRHFPDVDFSAEDGDLRLDQRWDAFYLQVLGVVQRSAPVLIATFVLRDLALVSVFAIHMAIANIALVLCASFSEGNQAVFGEMIVRKETERLQRTYRELQTITYTANSVVSSVAMVLITPFMGLYAGHVTDVDYVQPLIGFTVMLNVFLYHLKTPQGLLVISAGLYRATRVQNTVQTLLVIIPGAIFAMLWGVPGIMLGSWVSNVWRTIDLALFIPRNVTHTPPSDTFRRIALSCLKLALSVLPFAIARTNCTSWASWLLLACCATCWSVACSLAVTRLFEREQYRGLVDRAMRLVRR